MSSILSPVALKTNRGDFYLYEHYTEDGNGDGTGIYSIASGIFWSELGRAGGED